MDTAISGILGGCDVIILLVQSMFNVAFCIIDTQLIYLSGGRHDRAATPNVLHLRKRHGRVAREFSLDRGHALDALSSNGTAIDCFRAPPPPDMKGI